MFLQAGEKFKFSTKIKTTKNEWDGRRLKGKSLEVLERNERLNGIEFFLNEIAKEALLKKEVYHSQ